MVTILVILTNYLTALLFLIWCIYMYYEYIIPVYPEGHALQPQSMQVIHPPPFIMSGLLHAGQFSIVDLPIVH